MISASSTEDVLVLGAGPAGMAAAMELSRAGRTCTVVEKAAQVGGLAKTLEFKEPEGVYRTDIGPHRFFSKNQYLYDFIEDLLQEEWREVPRLTRFCVDGKFYLYPIRIRNVLSQIGLRKSIRMGTDYAWERGRALVAPRPKRSFEDYVVAMFGRTLASFNMLDYTEKIWGIPCNQISIDWALQRIGGLSLPAALLKALFPQRKGPKTLVDAFYYPSLGSGSIYDAILDRITRKGSTVLLESVPERIRLEGERVTSVDIRTPDGMTSVAPPAIVSSIPVPVLLQLFDPLPPQAVMDAASKLRFRDQVYLFLTVNKEQIMLDNWIYFPDKSIPFGRISEMKNFSKELCPPGRTSLFIEFFCFEGDSVWNASGGELFEKSIPHLARFGLLRREDVTAVHHFRMSHVYPIYDLEYSSHLRVIMEWLDGLENFYAIGRPGRFRYTNQDHSLEMGILAAQSILTGQRKDVENVGLEREYFERGYVRGER